MIAYLITIATLVALASLVGLGLNLQWGLAGLANFGIAGFYAVGAYTVALSPVPGVPALGLAMLACLGLGALLALLTARLEAEYLAIITIGFAEVVRLVSLNEGWLTNGALGLADVPSPVGFLPAGWQPLAFLGFALGMLLASFAVLEVLARSPFGRALRAVRDDDVVAATLGKDVGGLRVRAFALGGAVIGLAGGLHAQFLSYIDPSQFTSIVTAYAFMAVIAGGRGSNLGLILGAGSIFLLLESTRFLKDVIPLLDGTRLAALRLMLVGAGIVLLLILRPDGLMAEPRRLSRQLSPLKEP